MAITESEALASLRILVAIAQADGEIHEDERRSLSAALESLWLSKEQLGGMTIDTLLAEDVDVAAQLALLESDEARQQIYKSAYFMANADGACTPDEAAILDQIASVTNVTDDTRQALDRIFVGRASMSGSMSLAPLEVTNAVERAAEIKKRTLRYAVLTAALGAFPIPGFAIATDLAVIAVQLKMIRDIGALWGHALDAATAKTLLYGVGLGTGARLAVNNLAKLIPVWGSVIGATTSFVSTYALASVIDKVFSDGKRVEDVTAQPDDLRTDFRAAEAIARSVYEDQKDVIIASTRAYNTTFDTLSQQLSEGLITQEEFDEKVAELA